MILKTFISNGPVMKVSITRSSSRVASVSPGRVSGVRAESADLVVLGGCRQREVPGGGGARAPDPARIRARSPAGRSRVTPGPRLDGLPFALVSGIRYTTSARYGSFRSALPLGYGVIGSPADSGSVSLGSSPGTPAFGGLRAAFSLSLHLVGDTPRPRCPPAFDGLRPPSQFQARRACSRMSRA